MAIDRDKDAERAARIDALIEEVRTKAEATRQHAARTGQRLRSRERQARAKLDEARRKRSKSKPG
jgi:hypothetical protein